MPSLKPEEYFTIWLKRLFFKTALSEFERFQEASNRLHHHSASDGLDY